MTVVYVILVAVVALFVYKAVHHRNTAKYVSSVERAQMEDAQRERRLAAEKEKSVESSRDIKEREIEDAIKKSPGSEKYRLSKTQSEVNTSVLNITEFTKISKQRYIAFDLETTGLSYGSDNIVEIGAVLVENGEITAEYHQMVNPGRPIPSEASAVNHITDDMLIGQPKIHQVLPSFLSFVGDNVLVAHNARFDIRFINQACMVNRFRAPSTCFDTMEFARYWPESESKKLSSLIAAAGIENNNAHRALSDAKAVAAFVSATNKRRSDNRKKKNS